MIHKDYLMRLIAEFTRFLAKLLKLKQAKDYQGALESIETLLWDQHGLSSKLILSTSTDYLISILKLGGTFDVNKCILLALLLKEEASIYELQEAFEESTPRYEKALDLLLEASLSGIKTDLENYLSEIEPLLLKIPDKLDSRTRLRLFHYYDKTGNYALAEDFLFESLHHDALRDRVLDQGMLFYGRLLEKTDEELVAGNLPRDEVLAGLSELRQLK